jgi:hypothetical protein
MARAGRVFESKARGQSVSADRITVTAGRPRGFRYVLDQENGLE